MHSLARAAALYLRLTGVNIRGQLQYRLSFFLDATSTLLVNFVYFITLVAVFSRFDTIGGWGLGEVAFLYGLVEAGFALMDMLFSGYDPDYFSQQIRRGTFDLYLLRPISLPLQVFASEFLLRRLGRIAQAAVAFAVALALNPVHWTLAKVLYLPVVLASLVGFYGALFVIGSTICFWTVQSVEAVNIFTYGGTEMMIYPMPIYAPWLRRFFTYIVPAGLMAYYPALFFLDKPDPFGLPGFMPFLAPLAALVMLVGAFAFWRVGVRKYTSTGT